VKKAIVIGASSGIGRELALILSGCGHTVGVMARRIHLLEELSGQAKCDMFVRQIDAADPEAAMERLADLIHEMGGVDLIVITAGTGEINRDLSWRVEKEIIGTNVTGFAALANVAMHHFIERGSGHLVCISSIGALRGGRESPAYNASKAFESNYMEGLRQKITRLGLPVTITDIKPGYVKTAMARGNNIFWAAPADKAARQIHSAIKRKKSSAYITRRWKFIAWILKVIPARLYARL